MDEAITRSGIHGQGLCELPQLQRLFTHLFASQVDPVEKLEPSEEQASTEQPSNEPRATVRLSPIGDRLSPTGDRRPATGEIEIGILEYRSLGMLLLGMLLFGMLLL